MVDQLKTKTITFCLICPEQRVCLVIQRNNENPIVVEMEQLRPVGFWCKRVELADGEYRCRYYGGNVQNLTYYGRAYAENGADDALGLDAIVSVRIGQEGRASQIFPHTTAPANWAAAWDVALHNAN